MPPAALAAITLRGVPHLIPAAVRALGTAALVFCVHEELLVEAYKVPETPVSTAAFLLGCFALDALGPVAC